MWCCNHELFKFIFCSKAPEEDVAIVKRAKNQIQIDTYQEQVWILGSIAIDIAVVEAENRYVAADIKYEDNTSSDKQNFFLPAYTCTTQT